MDTNPFIINLGRLGTYRVDFGLTQVHRKSTSTGVAIWKTVQSGKGRRLAIQLASNLRAIHQSAADRLGVL